MDKKWAVVGYGRAGHLHTTALDKLGIDYQTMDIDPVKGADYATLRDIMEEYQPTHVSVATPNYTHFGLVGMFLTWYRRGLTVICEKPLCIKQYDAKIINVIASGRGDVAGRIEPERRVHYIAQNRYLTSWRKALELIKGQSVTVNYQARLVRGKAYYDASPWRGDIYQDGGPLYTQLAHHVDFLCYLGLDLTPLETFFGQDAAYQGITTVESWGNIRFESGQFQYEIHPEGEQSVELSINGESICKLGGRYLEEIQYPGGTLVDPVAQNVYAGGGGTAAHHYLQFLDILDGKYPVTLQDGIDVVNVIVDWYKNRPSAGY